ncbi:hypothetical protein F5B22DRAFT_500345 [Xylaria bambusicola]|uniref:uncharacterized protein n=1 Tax=Xylaria bambusicola TaxID=326684 RepID=UPI0020081EDA|nr:uncharacterized protein F5B22DRAFT_500345 [Xylaria bambusicola]KAI0521749.1 hypothetical protein F5B22DRAFT_500345 [Xylaria bambusicola]
MSSSFNSTGDAPTQRVPAWKRLGLKLKPASEGQSHDATHPPTTHGTVATPESSSSVPNNRAHLGGSTPNAKRRASGGAPALDHSAKRARQDNWQDQNSSSHQTPPSKKPKAVSFTADTAGPQPSVPVKTKQPKPKQPKGAAVNAAAAAPAKPIKKSAPVNLEPALAYLRTWHTARDSWKFNKNHQTRLLEQVFAGADETTIPAVDINVFYEYIRGLQGGVRTRLRELANGIKAQDMQAGAAGFSGVASKEMAERKQKEYDEVIKMFLGQPRTPEKRRFDEVEYVLRTTDMEMQRRVVKRMRAEMVLDELSETDASETTTATTTTTSGESTATEKGNPPGSGDGDDEKQRLKLNDGPQQRTKRKRKLRTAAVEDDTSSESESESESEDDTSSSGSDSSSGSSSGSSSDEDSDEEGGNRDNEDTSSSSSSSSSSESSDSEDDDD